MNDLSRRSLFKMAVGTATLYSFGNIFHLAAKAQDIAEGGSPYFFLSIDEARILKVLCDRLIPRDDYPSASEAGVIDFIDLQLATGWGKGEGLYLRGPFQPDVSETLGYQLRYPPAEFYRTALAAIKGDNIDNFLGQSPDQYDAFITKLENNEMALGDIPGRVFFSMLRANTSEGYFADPVYNGNRGYIGWRMLGFPGADAYYLTEFDNWNMPYHRPPSGIAHRIGVGTPPFTKSAVPAQSSGG